MQTLERRRTLANLSVWRRSLHERERLYEDTETNDQSAGVASDARARTPVTEARADLVLAGPPTITPSPVPQDGGGTFGPTRSSPARGTAEPGDSFITTSARAMFSFRAAASVSTDPFAPTTVVSSSGVITPTQTAALNWTFTWGLRPAGTFTIFVSLWSASNTPQMAAFVGTRRTAPDRMPTAD
jgi:hypothetical protein